VAKTGEKNTLFGVFKSACCGAEIVITSGSVFPECPKHPYVSASWEALEIGPDNLIFLPKKKVKGEPAA
jgi:hypothetical protein